MSEISINLAPKRKVKLGDKLLYFVLHYFRYIIVITQMVVISVFFYRLMQDQKIVELERKFKQNQRVLAIMQPIVDEAEALEVKTDKIETIIQKQDKLQNELQYIFTSIPQDIVLESIKVDESTANISGEAQNITSIRALAEKLKKSKILKDNTIKNIDKESDYAFSFSISIQLEE